MSELMFSQLFNSNGLFAAMFPRTVRYAPPAAPAKHPLD